MRQLLVAGRKKLSKRPRDTNQLAKFIVDVATGDKNAPLQVESVNTFARDGRLVGGKARTRTLTPERHREIAREA